MSKKPRKAPVKRRKHVKGETPATVIWRTALLARWGLSEATLWRYERDRKLPARDFRLGDRKGWKRATIEAFEASGSLQP